ncbi:hypothetical protein M2139_001622 [Enterococcus sp. PF1-24]|uniref:DUF3862 domain-containing protein n=1 Tax=unclassified Enterococcus TaxID=2608891 RepID=UPI0024770295|nr:MULTISPECIES: DUF3862 domain-containing protein [unclassified Enterococcus]MDH6364635.1 hypothetical protein [Enterococcus sp. PFB1-1]MDH6401736.1 hypothetical protein [Enterococcus sp. PF1-24]
MKKTLLTTLILPSLLLLGSCTTTDEKTATSTTATSTVATTTASSSIEEEIVSKELVNTDGIKTNFEKITLGDLDKQGEGGNTQTEVTAILGEATATSTSTTDDQNIETLSWIGLEDSPVTLKVSFIDGKAFSKTIANLTVADTEDITLEKFEAIATDRATTLAEVIAEVGEPNGKDITVKDGKNHKILSWNQNVAGKNADFNIQFVDDVVSSKMQVGME